MQGIKATYAFTLSYKKNSSESETHVISKTTAPVSATINILKTNSYFTKTSKPEILQIKWKCLN